MKLEFSFSNLFPKTEGVTFENNVLPILKGYDIWMLLNRINNKELLRVATNLRTFVNAVKQQNNLFIICSYFALNDKYLEYMCLTEEIDASDRQAIKEILSLILYAKFNDNNKGKDKDGVSLKLINILIGKLSTVINLLTYTSTKPYSIKTIGGEEVKDVDKLMSDFHKSKLKVNDYVVNLINKR